MKLLTTDRSNNPNKYQLPPLKWFQATSIDRTLEIGFTNSASIHIVFPCDHWAIKFFLTVKSLNQQETFDVPVPQMLETAVTDLLPIHLQ